MADESSATAACSVVAEHAQTQTTSTSMSPCNSVCQSPSASPPLMPAPPAKRKRSINPQADENFVKALEAVRFGGIGFCKAARMFGVNNRTLWLEYKKRGYPISRLSIKSRIKQDNSHVQPQLHNQVGHTPNQPAANNHTQPVVCPPTHSVAMIGATFPADFPPTLHRTQYQETSIMAAPSSHITVQSMNFGQM